MPAHTKGLALRVYVRDAELHSLRQLTEEFEIPQTEIMSRILSSGIRALREAGNRMPLPLKFEIVDCDKPAAYPKHSARPAQLNDKGK